MKAHHAARRRPHFAGCNLLEPLEPRTLLAAAPVAPPVALAAGNVLPIGVIDIATSTRVAGWTVDRDTPSQSLTISLVIDGVTRNKVTANLNRPDLTPIFGSANHGFDIALPALSLGIHRIEIISTDSSNSSLVASLGSRTVSNVTAPIGFIDGVNPTFFTGWTFSGDAASTPIEIRYSIDNNPPVLASSGIFRRDLARAVGSTNHGFLVVLPTLTAGAHTVTIDAFDQFSELLTPLGTRAFIVTNPVGTHHPIGNLDFVSNNRAIGWAWDADTPLQSIHVRIDVDGIAGLSSIANVNRPDLTGPLGSPNHGFNVGLSLTAGNHRIDLFALEPSPGSGSILLPVYIGSKNTVTVPPTATVDIFSPTRIAGWAHAASTPFTPVQIRLDVDNLQGAPITANLPRADLAFLGATTFAFDFPTTNIGSGLHMLRLFLIDPITESSTLIRTQTVLIP